MRVHIFGDSHSPMNGYLNLAVKEGDVLSNLDSAVCDSEAVEIVLNNALEYLQPKDVISFLERVVSKLRHTGELIVNGIDAYTVAKHFVMNKLTIEEFNILMLGKKSTALTMHGMRNFLCADMGLKILSAKLEEYSYVIKAKRL